MGDVELAGIRNREARRAEWSAAPQVEDGREEGDEQHLGVVARDLGVRFSVGTPDRAPDAVEIGMQLLASGELRLPSQQTIPMSQAADAHRLLEENHVHHKLLLEAAK